MTDYCMKKSEWIKCSERLPEESGYLIHGIR